MSKVLVVDDEPALIRAMAINLRAHGWEVVTAADGRSALDAAATEHPDVIVLDLGLPDIDGNEVIAGPRGWTKVPIVVLSVRQASTARPRSRLSTSAPTTTSRNRSRPTS